jgi:3-oxoacyl-[acyl-carrier protein] reductase
LAQRIGGVAVQADLRIPQDANRLVEESLSAFDCVDILVNNAASFAHASSFVDESWDTYQEEFTGVFGTAYNCISAVIPTMIAQGRGSIINFAATLIQRPAVGFGAHSCAKAAVLAMTHNFAKELGPHNITVNAVSPGMTLSDYSLSVPQEMRDKIASLTPLQRLASPEDVASICLFYASDMAKFVTGANIAPDGGLAIL